MLPMAFCLSEEASFDRINIIENSKWNILQTDIFYNLIFAFLLLISLIICYISTSHQPNLPTTSRVTLADSFQRDLALGEIKMLMGNYREEGLQLLFMSQWQRENCNHLQQKIYSPWAQLNPYLTQLFSTQFPSENRAAFTLSLFKPSTYLNITSRICKRGRERVNNLQLQQQIDLFISTEGQGYAWLKFTNDQVKIHYNHHQGLDILGLGKWTPYASFSSTRKFKNSSFKVGAEQKWSNGSIDLRGRYNIGEHRADSFYYGKFNYQSSLMRASAILVMYEVAKQAWLQKNDITAAYRLWGDHWVGIVLDSDGFRNYKINYARFGSYFDSLKAVYLYHHQRLQAGFLYQYSIEDSSSKKMEAAAQYTRSNWAVKLRLNSLWEAGLVVKAQKEQWKIEFGSSWFNVTRSAWPSFYSLGLSYY